MQRIVWLAVLFLMAAVLNAAPYHRIASVTLMGDEFLALLAPSSDILAYSRFADDPGLSNVTAQAAQVKNRAWLNLELLLKLKPDLVIAADWSDASLLSFLRDQGIPVYVIKTPRSWNQVKLQTTALAQFLSLRQSGENLLARLEAQEKLLAQARAQITKPKTVLEYSSMGTSMGKSTLWNDVCALAGLDNLAQGLSADAFGYAPLSKEMLLRLNPDLLVLPAPGALKAYNQPDFLKNLQSDAVFQSLKAVKNSGLIFLPESLKTTTSPFALEAASALAHAAYPNLR